MHGVYWYGLLSGIVWAYYGSAKGLPWACRNVFVRVSELVGMGVATGRRVGCIRDVVGVDIGANIWGEKPGKLQNLAPESTTVIPDLGRRKPVFNLF